MARTGYVETRGGAAMTVKAAHMVSKGYIRAWADAKNTVDVLDLQDGRGYRSSYLKATVVSYVYDPEVLTRDLEHDYWKIEDLGIPAIVKLREGQPLTDAEQCAVIKFLDMHLDRGRYADKSKAQIPAVVLKTRGRIENAELNLADLLLLSQSFSEVLRLTQLGIEDWPWRVREARGLATGDGAVLLWRPTGGEEISTISFPLSPTRLLVIGQDLPDDAPLNPRLAGNSRRWVVGEKGTLNLKSAATVSVRRSQG